MLCGKDCGRRWTAVAVAVALTLCSVLAQDNKDCGDGAFFCSDGSGCVDTAMVQDGVPDCPDASDEGCLPLQFRCPCLVNGAGRRGPRCLGAEMVRDGVEDCADGADERPEEAAASECPLENHVERWKRKASEVSTRIDGPVTTSMFAGGTRRVRPTGILTSTAGTFVLDGTTTEFATKVYGTHLDDGVYAKIVSTSSRVFFAVPSAGRIRPTGLLSSATSTRVAGAQTTLYTTEFSGTYIDGTYAQLVSSTSRVVVEPTTTQQTLGEPPREEDDQVVTVTGTRGALVDGSETKYAVFTGTHVKGDKTYQFFFGNTALSPTATSEEVGGTATLPDNELVLRKGADDRIVVSVDDRELNLVLPKSAKASAAESEPMENDSGMKGVFIEGSLGGFSILGASEGSDSSSTQTEMLTVTVGRGVAQTKIVRGRYDGLDDGKESVTPSKASYAAQPEKTVYHFQPRIPSLRPPRPGGLPHAEAIKQSNEEAREEEEENLLKARKVDLEAEKNPTIRPSKVHRVNLPTFTVGQDGIREDEGKVVVRVDQNVEARVGPRKDYRTLSSRQRLGKSLPFRGFQVIHEKEDLVNAESGGSVPVPTITYFGFAEFTTTASGTVIVFQPRSMEATLSTASHSPKTTAVSAYRQSSTRLPESREGPAFESSKQKVATGIKTFYSHTPGMVTRTVTGHTLSMQTSLPTILVEPVFGVSANGREKSGRSEEDAELVYPTSDAPEEISKEEELGPSQSIMDVHASTFTFTENAHGRPFSVDLEPSTVQTEPSQFGPISDQGLLSTIPTEPLHTSGIVESTESHPVGIIRSIEGTRALDGTTTVFTSLIYGTYINGNYKKVIQTTSSVLKPGESSEIPTTHAITEERVTTEETTTEPSEQTIGDTSDTTFVTKEMAEETTPPTMTTEEEALSTIPIVTTEENELANEVETGRRVNNRPEEQEIVAEEADKEMISALGKGAPTSAGDEQETSYIYSVIPTTVYQTYTYFTTFYIPSDGTTSTSIRSREVIASELSLLTIRKIAPTAMAETTFQSQVPTTPMTPEETPELPKVESTTAETIITTTPTTKEEPSEEEGDEQSEEIELIFKTLYTTYTYLTTFFHDTTTSVSSREVVMTNVLTSTLNSITLATEPALAGLVRDYDLSTSVTTPYSYEEEEEEAVPTSVGVGRPTTQYFSEDLLSSTPTTPLFSTPVIESLKSNEIVPKGSYRTFYTTYTYFTTVFVDGETEISSRTEVYTNIIPPSGHIGPTSTAESSSRNSGATVEPSIQTESELESQVRPSISVSHPERYSSTIMHRSGRKKVESTTPEVTTEPMTEVKPIEQDSLSISSENHEEKEKPTLMEIHEEISINDNTVGTESKSSSSETNINTTHTTEKYFGVTKFEEVGEPEKLVSEEDDQESSESNTEVVLPLPLPSPTATQYSETSVLVQTTFTTFTYFTTLYRGGTSEVVSRLETVTNIMTVTVDPTSVLADNILSTDAVSIKPTFTEPLQELETTDVDESLYPITYFTTFTYWTTAYKGGSTIVNSREETVSNIVTPTGRAAITREIENIPTTVSAEPTSSTVSKSLEATATSQSLPESTTISPSAVATPQLTTFYTTYTYFTTSYVGESTIVNSRLETVTNVETGDKQTARAVGTSPPSQQLIITPTSTSLFSTGLLSTIRTSSVGEDSRTTLYSTDVYGTYIDGLYAKVLESSTKVLDEPIKSTLPELPKLNLQPTGIVSLNAGSIVDADGTATTYYSTMAIGTFIGNLYAQVVESTSSIVLNTDKTDIPLNTDSQRTGLVRLIKGSIVKGDSTTLYESRVVGTVIDGRYAQIIESTSSFGSAEATITPTSTTAAIVTPTVAPVLESSLGEVGSKEEEENEEEEEGSQEEDEEDSNNANKGRVTSRLTFSSRRRTFTPVIRPFSSRNRPTFHPRRRPTSATTITRVTQTPTVTATPAHTDYLAATAARGRFSSRRGGASADVRASAVGGGRRFSRIRGSSSSGVYGSSSYVGGGRGRGSSSRITPTVASQLPFAGSRSRPGSYRSSFSGRSSSEYPYGRTATSAALFAANSRYRIRPSSTLAHVRPSAISSPPPFDRNTVEDEDEETEGDEEEEVVGTEKEEGTRATEPTESNIPESALTPTTEGTTSPLRRPLLRLRRPNQYQPLPPPSTTPSSLPRSTAARRLSLLRRPSSEENLPTEDRKPSRQRYKTSTTSATKPANAPTTPRPRPPPRLQVLNRPRPTSSLFPRRGLFRRPGEEQEKLSEEVKEEDESEEDAEIVEEAESSANDATEEDDSYNLDEAIADNDYEASEDVKRKNEPPQVLIRPFSPRRRRLKRQAEYGTRGTSNLRGYSNRFRRPASRKSATPQETEARVGVEEEEVFVEEEVAPQKLNEGARQSNSRSRNSGQQQQPRVRPTAAQPRSQYSIAGSRTKNTNGNTNGNVNNYREPSNSRTNFRRPSTAPVRRRNKSESTVAGQQQQQQQRPKPPRLRTQSDTQTTTPSKPRSRNRYSNRARSQAATTSTNTGRGRYRTSDLETNDYSTRRQHQSSWDGKVTVTLQVPTEATIPVINGKNTEYRRVVTASLSTQILTPGQYEATDISGLPGLLLLGRDITATPTPGVIHVTQYVARETPTTSVEFTPTVIRGRKTSFSHVVPSTAYGVEEVVSTLPSESGLLPSAPLANILLSQLLLGQFGLQGNVNPLLGLQQQNGAALAPPTPTTEYKTRSTTFVTTLTDKTSTVIPITLRGKAILTTIVDSSVQVVTATEFITDTIVVTPTAGQQQQLNSLLLPALLQAQLLNQQQQQQPLSQPVPGQLTNLQAAQLLQQQQAVIRPDNLDIDPKELIQEEEYVDNVSPVTERRRQPSSSRRRNRPHKRVETIVDDEEGQRPARGSTEDNPRPKTRKNKPSSGRKQNPPAERQYETSVITLYVSGRRPGDFSTVLSTISVETGGSSLVKREAVSPKRPHSVQKVTESPSLDKLSYFNSQELDNSPPHKDPNILISPSLFNYVQNSEVDKQYVKDFSQETESLESIVGDVSKHVIYQSSSIPSTWSASKTLATIPTSEEGPSASSSTPRTGYFLADGPAESAPLKRKVLSIDEGDEEETEIFLHRTKRDEEEDRERPARRRRVRVRVPVRRQHEEEEEEKVEEETRPQVAEESEEKTANGGRKRIRVKVRRKPSSVINDILPTEVRNSGTSQVRSGRRRVVVTKKRPLSSSMVTESMTLESPTIENTGRHRVIITRKRPVQRQSTLVLPSPAIQNQEEEFRTKVPQQSVEERPLGRKIPQGGPNEEFGSKKLATSDKEAVKSKTSQYRSKITEVSEEVLDERSRVQEVNVKETEDWVPSKTVAPSIKSIEIPSLQSSEESADIGQTSVHEEEFSGPKFVRPTRFSVTRRPSGDFLQKVQSLRTKAPIVFPSRRRAPASTRQPAYRSRLSRLRGRPSTTSEATTVFSEEVLPLQSVVTSIIATEAPTLTPTLTSMLTPTSSLVPIYTTEVVTETLWKTYTYVVSRVESSAEAGVVEAAPPSLAAVSSSTQVKQVLKTQTITRLVSPTAASSSAVADTSTAEFNDTAVKDIDIGGRAIGNRINLDAARFNLATRVMSNGVEVIVAGDKTTLPGGPDVLRILSSASRPITLAPSTLSDQMQLTMPTALGRPQVDPESLLQSLQSQAANFVTKTYATTYTYLTTFLEGSSTVVSSREDVITNIVTEEVRPTKPIEQHTVTSSAINDALTSKVDGPPSFVTSTYRTTFTYLNTIIDGEVPVVLTTRQTVANTVTAPATPSKISGSSAEESDHLQPSEPTLYDTNTYFNTFTLTKTLSDSASGVKVISTEDVLTQVVITEASTSPMTKAPITINPTSTTSIVKTYFVTYTYYNTFLEKGSTVVKTNVATSSDVVTEKFYLAPTRTQPVNRTPSLSIVPNIGTVDEQSTSSVIPQPPLSVFATKTYMTTFTYFTTLLENDRTVTRSSVSVSTNLATEAITAGLDSVYLDSLRSSFSMQTANVPIVATVMLSGTPMEITAFQGSMLDNSKGGSKTESSSSTISSTEASIKGEEPSPTRVSSSPLANIIVGSTIIFFDDIKPEKPHDVNELSATASLNSESTTNVHEIKDEEITPPPPTNTAHTDTPEFLLNGLLTSPTPVDGAISAENVVSVPDKSYITSTITASTVIASGNGLATTLVPGDAVIVSMGSDGNVSLIPVSDPANKNPDGALLGAGAVESAAGGGGLITAASGGPNIGDLINLGSLSLNGLNALGPVFNAMAGLLQSNLKSAPSRRNDTTTPYPPTTPRTPPPIALPRPPAPQSAPLIRDPVYIPVGGLASLNSENIDPIAAESSHGESIEAYYGQNFPIHGFPDTEERRPPPSPVKPSMPTTLTLDNPLLLQNGIPIQPGQVITTNSDVIVGKPSVLGPRPSPHGAIPQIFPQNHPPLPPMQFPPPQVHMANHPSPSIYPPKHSIGTPPRVRPSNNVPPEMKPPPPPRYPPYSGVSPTRVSVISGVETVFIGKPLPPHMIPENNSPQTHLIPQLPSHPSGPLRPNHPSLQVPPPIVIGSPLENLNPRPAIHHNHNTIDRSTGYKIHPSQPLNTQIDAVTLSVGSETNVRDSPGSVFYVNVQAPSGGRPGSVLNEGEPHSGAHLSLGQAHVHNVPVGTGGEVVVEIGRPPITNVLKQSYGEETKIITNENSSEENKGVVHEEGDILTNREPTIIHLGQFDKNNHGGNVIIGHGRPQHHPSNQPFKQNYYVPGRPNLPHSNIVPYPNVQHSPPVIHRPPPPNLYVNNIPPQPSPVDHLMPPDPPQTNPSIKLEGFQNQPMIIPLNHGTEDASQGNHYDNRHPTISNNIQEQWITDTDDYLEEPEDGEGVQDGEVLQESNNHPVRPQKLPNGGQQITDQTNRRPEFQENKDTSFVTNFQHSKPETNSQQSSHTFNKNNSSLTDELKTVNKENTSFDVTSPKPMKQHHILSEAQPYPFEIPDMSPPPPPKSNPTQSHRLPINAQRPPPGAVSRPAIRPQDYNPDFLDKPVRVVNRPLSPSISSDGALTQENAIKPEISRPPVRVVVRPVSPRPRPPYHNHHIPQSRPSQNTHWPRPLRPIKPLGPVQVVRQPSQSQSSAWQPSFSTTTQKEIIRPSTIPYLAIKPTTTSKVDYNKESTADSHISSTFSSEREPLVVIPSPSSSEIFVESSGVSILWDGEHFNSIPTVELPPPIKSSSLSDSLGSTLLLSGTSTIFGGLYSRPTSSKSSESTQLSDLFLSPSSHGAIAGTNGGHIADPHHYSDEDEELENEFEEGEGLGAAGSNDAATSIVVVSVTATPTTRYITRTETETHTVTQTVVETHPGSPPHTRTVIVTRTIPAEMARPITIVSTIVGTVTEVHTTIHSSTTTAVTTVTVTAPTQWPLHTMGSYSISHSSKETSAGSQNSDENDTLESISSGNNHIQGSPLDQTNLVFTTSKDNLHTHDKESVLGANEPPLSNEKELDINENENVVEGYTTNVLPMDEMEKEEDEPVCKPECEAARNEICVNELTEEEMIAGIDGPRCVCRPGFARLFPDRPCMPTYTYQLRLLLDRIGKHRLSYHPDLQDPQTEEFHQLQEATQDGLERVAMQSDIRDLFHGISIAGFDSPSEETDNVEDSETLENSKENDDIRLVDNKESIDYPTSEDGVIVNFYVKLSDNIEEEKLKEVFEKTLKQTNYSVGGTDLYARRKEGLLEIYDFDECSNVDFNDCSDQAQCFNLHGTYTCSCKEGYADLSENSEFPGRICSAEVLGCETCKYHGQCYTDTNGKIGCKCFHWYTGDNCQINLKVLLIALVTIGAILLILVFICIMLACMKRKKPDLRHTAPGFMRYRGPAGIARGGGTMDKTAMIPDTSSESSFEGALPPPPLTYVPLVHHRLSTSTQGSKMKSEALERREKVIQAPMPMPMSAGFNEQDRSLTVMIPRAKYRPAPPLLNTGVSGSPSPMTSFGVVLLEEDTRERRMSAPNEQKLLAYLDGNDPQSQGRQGTPTKQKQIGPVVTNHETSGNPKKISSSRKPSTGALVSAGFEVSATVVKDKWPPESRNDNAIEEYADDASGPGIEGHLHHTLASNGSHFTTLRTGDRTVSEARSYDETIVHLPKKSLLQSGCGSKPSSQHGLHHSNDEAHTMAERDVGSTFLMPQTQLYKPSRGSDNSNFDSL